MSRVNGENMFRRICTFFSDAFLFVKIVVGMIVCQFYDPKKHEYAEFRSKHESADLVESIAAMFAYGIELSTDPRFNYDEPCCIGCCRDCDGCVLLGRGGHLV